MECIGDGTCAFKLLQPADNFGRYATSTAVLTFAGASFYRALSRPDAEKGWKDAWLEQCVGPHQPLLHSPSSSPYDSTVEQTVHDTVRPSHFELIPAS